MFSLNFVSLLVVILVCDTKFQLVTGRPPNIAPSDALVTIFNSTLNLENAQDGVLPADALHADAGLKGDADRESIQDANVPQGITVGPQVPAHFGFVTGSSDGEAIDGQVRDWNNGSDDRYTRFTTKSAEGEDATSLDTNGNSALTTFAKYSNTEEVSNASAILKILKPFPSYFEQFKIVQDKDQATNEEVESINSFISNKYVELNSTDSSISSKNITTKEEELITSQPLRETTDILQYITLDSAELTSVETIFDDLGKTLSPDYFVSTIEDVSDIFTKDNTTFPTELQHSYIGEPEFTIPLQFSDDQVETTTKIEESREETVLTTDILVENVEEGSGYVEQDRPDENMVQTLTIDNFEGSSDFENDLTEFIAGDTSVEADSAFEGPIFVTPREEISTENSEIISEEVTVNGKFNSKSINLMDGDFDNADYDPLNIGHSVTTETTNGNGITENFVVRFDQEEPAEETVTDVDPNLRTLASLFEEALGVEGMYPSATENLSKVYGLQESLDNFDGLERDETHGRTFRINQESATKQSGEVEKTFWDFVDNALNLERIVVGEITNSQNDYLSKVHEESQATEIRRSKILDDIYKNFASNHDKLETTTSKYLKQFQNKVASSKGTWQKIKDSWDVLKPADKRTLKELSKELDVEAFAAFDDKYTANNTHNFTATSESSQVYEDVVTTDSSIYTSRSAFAVHNGNYEVEDSKNNLKLVNKLPAIDLKELGKEFDMEALAPIDDKYVGNDKRDPTLPTTEQTRGSEDLVTTQSSVYTSSGTFTVPYGNYEVEVEVAYTKDTGGNSSTKNCFSGEADFQIFWYNGKHTHSPKLHVNTSTVCEGVLSRRLGFDREGYDVKINLVLRFEEDVYYLHRVKVSLGPFDEFEDTIENLRMFETPINTPMVFDTFVFRLKRHIELHISGNFTGSTHVHGQTSDKFDSIAKDAEAEVLDSTINVMIVTVLAILCAAIVLAVLYQTSVKFCGKKDVYSIGTPK